MDKNTPHFADAIYALRPIRQSSFVAGSLPPDTRYVGPGRGAGIYGDFVFEDFDLPFPIPNSQLTQAETRISYCSYCATEGVDEGTVPSVADPILVSYECEMLRIADQTFRICDLVRGVLTRPSWYEH
jgi:hypothetical protein